MDNKEIKEARKTNFTGINISANVYNLIIGLVLMWGVILNIVMAQMFGDAIQQINYIVLILLYFAGSITSIIVIYKSNNPVISFVGFNVLSVSMGLILINFVSYFDIGSIVIAFATTAVITAIMTILATIFPTIFSKLGKTLFITLIISIIVELLVIIIIGTDPMLFDFLFVIIFCGYIGYDWSKAQQYPPTIDNAIDSAADMYVDVVNLFVRILSIIGKKH